MNHAAGNANPAPVADVPRPGSQRMPPWNVDELINPPTFRWKYLASMLGPGLVMGAAAVGGGEWLTGPLVTAKYGAALLWLSTLSILGQVIYNIEISRYTLYTGEPIFTGKFRTAPGPMFWPWVYVLLDFGSFLPYLASSAAVPLAALILGRLPDTSKEAGFIKFLACGIFLGSLLPLFVGGKVYRSLKFLMTFKLIVVMGFLGFLALGYSTWSTWSEICLGFLNFGAVPVLDADGASRGQTANVVSSLINGHSLPWIDIAMIGTLASMAAISGNGGLTNTPVSNFTRDQGWGMGHHVGAIPSIIGGQSIQLSHVGSVFRVNSESLKRWSGWVQHVQREQFFLWMPACFLGIALPSMLSMQFLTRGTDLKDKWLAAGMTADGVATAIGPTFGGLFWYLTLFCGVLVLTTSMVSTADGVLRRWVDVAWTASARVRTWDTRHIGKFYFGALVIYAIGGLTMLMIATGNQLLELAAGIAYNFALGFSCLHVLAVNTLLLPRELQPGWSRKLGLALAGLFFLTIATLTTIDKFGGFATPPAPAASATSADSAQK